MGYRVVVDREVCQASALCVASAPALFTLGDDGVAEVLADTPDDGLRALVDEAAARCPSGAIRVVRDLNG